MSKGQWVNTYPVPSSILTISYGFSFNPQIMPHLTEEKNKGQSSNFSQVLVDNEWKSLGSNS